MIGGGSEPVQAFNKIDIAAHVMIRHGGTVLPLVKVEETPNEVHLLKAKVALIA
ncbi:MAG: hypothetical protein H7320_23630 [Ferruginibacter sp.]|nr:hypothetical protein [Ferruginibacter sp.]